MDYIITAVVFVLIFSLLILVHELGHFLMAKRAGIKVEEFGFGLPPRIFGKKVGETIYSINLIPFGGFVRMLGEDSRDPKSLKNKRSFIAQSPRKRILVVIAGVVMNFLLAWVLLTAGFTIGMQPLLSPDDIVPAIDRGLISIESGLKVKSVVEESKAMSSGLEEGDVLAYIDGKIASAESMQLFMEGTAKQVVVFRGNEEFSIDLPQQYIGEGQEFGVEFFDFSPFPRLRVNELNEDSLAFRSGVRPGDFLIKINGKQIFSFEDYEKAVIAGGELKLIVLRPADFKYHQVSLDLNLSEGVMISGVMRDSAAFESGLQKGDLIISVNGEDVKNPEVLIGVLSESQGQIELQIDRDGSKQIVNLTPENGKIGVFLSELKNYSNIPEVELYNTDLVSYVKEIKDIKYPFHVALYKSVEEGYRLSKFTAVMFLDFIGGLVSTGDVPDTVAGPVGIAQLTHVFVQDGLVPVLRFIALLSLSLGVINILPLPALDGGRLFFILIEVLVGHRVNQKWESYIHAIGYALLLLLILVVTFSDILRIVS